MSIVTTDNTQAFPEQAAAARARAEQAAQAAGLVVTLDDILRFVPGNRIILRGRLANSPAVFRLPLNPESHKHIAREWAELTRSYAYMATGPNRVAKPLCFDETSGLMAMSLIDGMPLMRHLWSLDTKQRNAPYAHAGAWLSAYTAPSQTTRPANSRHWLRRAKEAAAQQPHPALAEIEQRIFRNMRHLAKRIEPQEWRVAITHGDFHPNNLILSGDVLTGIDTGGSSIAPIYKDIARSLTHMARRGLYFGPKRHFGMDALAFDAMADAMHLNETERTLFLPYLICFETLFRVEHPDMPSHRVQHAIDMAQNLLRDLRQIT